VLSYYFFCTGQTTPIKPHVYLSHVGWLTAHLSRNFTPHANAHSEILQSVCGTTARAK
jgi:hypothetical protein